MTSHLNSHRTTDIEPEMLAAVQTGNGTPHDKYNIIGIAHARTNRQDDIFMQRQLVQKFTFTTLPLKLVVFRSFSYLEASSELVVASLSFAEFGTAQSQLVICSISKTSNFSQEILDKGRKLKGSWEENNYPTTTTTHDKLLDQF